MTVPHPVESDKPSDKPFRSYREYINSAGWQERRRRFFRKHSRECWCCTSTRDVHLHHLDYERMGCEPDGDLMGLCQSCHDLVHRFATMRPDLSLRDATMFAIAELRHNRATAPKPKVVAFVPLRQRLSQEQRKQTPLSGREGRLSGLPLRVVRR